MVEKICRACKLIYFEGDVCPQCGSEEQAETYKGKIRMINPEQSEIAQKLNIKKKGEYAVKLG